MGRLQVLLLSAGQLLRTRLTHLVMLRLKLGRQIREALSRLSERVLLDVLICLVRDRLLNHDRVSLSDFVNDHDSSLKCSPTNVPFAWNTLRIEH